MKRECGSCQLCCKLLPVTSINKGAGHKCKYQRHRKGCAIYKQLMGISPECRLWSCVWLLGDNTEGLGRPDRTHYVIDPMPDKVTIDSSEYGVSQEFRAIQIWCDPDYPDAHRDPALRAHLERLSKRNILALVRYNAVDALVLLPPVFTGHGFLEMSSKNSKIEVTGDEHINPDGTYKDSLHMLKAIAEVRGKK